MSLYYSLDHQGKKCYFGSSARARESFKIEMVDEFPNRNWDFKYISRRFEFDISWLDKYPDADWDFKMLSKNVNILDEVSIFSKLI